jgi:hypothetical protein
VGGKFVLRDSSIRRGFEGSISTAPKMDDYDQLGTTVLPLKLISGRGCAAPCQIGALHVLIGEVVGNWHKASELTA